MIVTYLDKQLTINVDGVNKEITASSLAVILDVPLYYLNWYLSNRDGFVLLASSLANKVRYYVPKRI